MSSPLPAILTELTQSTAVTALVSSRIFVLQAPQGVEHPFVILTAVSDSPENSLDGGPSDRLFAARVQVDAYARTYLQAHQVADAVFAVLGALTRPELSATLESKQDTYEDETRLYRIRADFQVFHG